MTFTFVGRSPDGAALGVEPRSRGLEPLRTGVPADGRVDPVVAHLRGITG